MARKSSDYIKSETDYQNEKAEREEFLKTVKDPRKTYKLNYYIPAPLNQQHEEEIVALSQKDAIEQCISQWSMCGVFLKSDNIKIEEIK